MDPDPNPGPILNIDAVVKACIEDPRSRDALAMRLCKTLLPWEQLPDSSYCRKSLLGAIEARGQRSWRDKDRADASLVERGFTLLNETEETEDEDHARALRVPAQIPNRWVYLRSWTAMGTFQERTWNSSIFVCTALPERGTVCVSGLPLFQCAEGSIRANMTAIDRWLFSLGAEEVPHAEWPANCVGPLNGTGPARSDRTPFGQSTLDYELWADWVSRNEPTRKIW